MHESTLLVHFKKGVKIYGNTHHRKLTSITHLNIAPLQEGTKTRLVQSLTLICVQYSEQPLHLILLTTERVLQLRSIPHTGT